MAYHHGDLRQSLIRTGVELARAGGASGVVLRETARRSGVSHNAAYRHFEDREALLAEVSAIAMQKLGTAMLEELEEVDSSAHDAQERATERLHATGRAYVGFAVAEPGLFDVAFSSGALADPTADPASLEGTGSTAHPFSLLGEVLDEGVEVGTVARDLRPGAEVMCWSAVHGFAVLHVQGPLRDTPEAEREEALQHLLDRVAGGLAPA